MKKIIFFISFLWQIPQNLIGVYLWIRETVKENVLLIKVHDNVIWIYLSGYSTLPGVSLGNFILIREDGIKRDPFIERHEFGHAKQSWLLGWFYLLVIGIPSFINHIRSGMDDEFRKKYFY